MWIREAFSQSVPCDVISDGRWGYGLGPSLPADPGENL
jgi:hypothetical protein